MGFLDTTSGKVLAAIVIVIVIIIIVSICCGSMKETLDALPDASTMVFGVLPRAKTVAHTVAAGGWAKRAMI